MREIKFRAWAKLYKVMANKVTLSNTDLLEGDISKLDPSLIIMQYTGLKDKNGVEIYEGDIVKVFDITENPVLEEVLWYNSRWCIKRIDKRYSNGLTKKFIEKKQPEVIGNIYENKNLIK